MKVDVAVKDAQAQATTLRASRAQPGTRAVPSGQGLGALTAATTSAAVAVDALLVASPFAGEAAFWPAIVAALAVGLFAARGLYDFGRGRAWSSQLSGVVSSISVTLVAAVALATFLGMPFDGTWTIASAALAIPLVTVWHLGIGRSYGAVAGLRTPLRRAIIVGAGRVGLDVARDFERIGYEIVGHVNDDRDTARRIDGSLLGPINRLDELVEGLAIDELIIASSNDRPVELRRILTRGFARPVRVRYALDVGDLRLPSRLGVRRVGHTQYIDFAPAAPVGRVKRAMDLLIAMPLLVVLVPVFVAIATAIKLESPGPVFYRQVRVGKDGRPFSILKFRSMRRDADALIASLKDANEVSGPMFKIRRDPRVTRVGRVLRRTSIDELPQLINVVRGEMSLVGPRPPLAAEVERYQDWEVGRLRAVPGMTGLWQISGRTELTFQEMVRLDLHYVHNWSLALDVEIMLRTIPAILASKGAY